MATENGTDAQVRAGRQPSTTIEELSHIGLGLFIERGFDATTVDDIAAAAGIGRRTFFRYFSSKNDLPWGDFDTLVQGMRARLAAAPEGAPLMPTLLAAVIDFNSFPPSEQPYHRERMRLLLEVPALAAHSTLRYASWRAAVAEFVARRLGTGADALAPQTIAWGVLAASLAAYEQWLNDGDDLGGHLTAAFSMLGQAFGPVA